MHSTERAALRLALGLLRRSCSYRAEDQDERAARVLSEVKRLPSDACWRAWSARTTPPFPSYRILRARLALYLRAVLRTEAPTVDHASRRAGEWEAYTLPVNHWVGYVCRSVRFGGEYAAWNWPTSDAYERVRLAVPLWSQAPGRSP